jgi:hypothetical protein
MTTRDQDELIKKRPRAARATLAQTQQRVNAIQADLYAADLKAFTVIVPVKPRRWRFRRPPEIGRPDTLGPVLSQASAQRVMNAWRAAPRQVTRRLKHFTAQVRQRADRLKAARQQDIKRMYSPIVDALDKLEWQLPTPKRK